MVKFGCENRKVKIKYSTIGLSRVKRGSEGDRGAHNEYLIDNNPNCSVGLYLQKT